MSSTIKFKSFLSPWLEDYLVYRKNVGFTCGDLRWFFSTFDRFILEKDAKVNDLDASFLLDFRSTLLHMAPSTVNKIFILLRGFLDYLIRMRILQYNPARDVPAVTDKSYMPFIFSANQVDELLKSIQGDIRKTDEKVFFKDLAVYTSIMLMARCGLRISEPIRLKTAHYRHDEKTLYIEKTKFNKDRLIPVPRRASAELENYLSLRNKIVKKAHNKSLLSVSADKAIAHCYIYSTFHRAVRSIGIVSPKRTVGNMVFGQSRPHSLRHAFAVSTLKNVRKRGKSAQNALPVLAAYLGHTDYRYTMKYLKAVDAENRRALVDFCIFHGKGESL